MAEAATITGKYLQAIGRRKQAVAQVRLFPGGSGKVVINKRDLAEYIPVKILEELAISPFKETGTFGQFDVTVQVKGGGIAGQAGAIRLGIARALIEHNEDFRTVLKKAGFLTRDARVKERKKYGLRGARRAPQWSKR